MIAREARPNRATARHVAPLLRRFAVRRTVTRWPSVLIVEAGQPGGQPLDSGLELGVFVDELLQAPREPLDAQLLVAAPLDEFLDAAVGEVHRVTRTRTRRCRAAAPRARPANPLPGMPKP